MLHNFTWIQQNLVQWSVQGYITVFGLFFYPIVFTALVGYLYLKNRSATAAVVGMLIIFAIFGQALIGVEIWTIVMHLITVLVIAALILIFITKRRQ